MSSSSSDGSLSSFSDSPVSSSSGSMEEDPSSEDNYAELKDKIDKIDRENLDESESDEDEGLTKNGKKDGRKKGRKKKADKKPTTRANTKKRKRDADHPKKNVTPYILFLKEKRNEIKQKLLQERPTAPLSEVMKRVGNEWRILPAADKEKYERLSKADAERYNKEKIAFHEKKKLAGTLDNKDHSGEELDTYDPPNKRQKRNVPKTKLRNPKQKRLKVRSKGDNFFDRIVLTQFTVNKLIGKIQEKRKDFRPISLIIQLPDVRIRDNQDVAVLDDDAELEVVYTEDINKSESNQKIDFIQQKIETVQHKIKIEPHHQELDHISDLPQEDEALPNVDEISEYKPAC